MRFLNRKAVQLGCNGLCWAAPGCNGLYFAVWRYTSLAVLDVNGWLEGLADQGDPLGPWGPGGPDGPGGRWSGWSRWSASIICIQKIYGFHGLTHKIFQKLRCHAKDFKRTAGKRKRWSTWSRWSMWYRSELSGWLECSVRQSGPGGQQGGQDQ